MSRNGEPTVHEQVSLIDDPCKQDYNTQEYKAYDEHRRIARTVRSMPYYALAIIFFVTIVDVCTIIYASHILREIYFEDDMASLPLGDPYIGLTELYTSSIMNATRVTNRNILNKPRIVTPVYAGNPSMSTAEEELIADGQYGTFSPHEKHFSVDQRTITIVQFRTIDFGLELCSLMLLLPDANSRVEGNHPFTMSIQPPTLRICQLDVDRSLDPTTLTWRSRPSCGHALRTTLLTTKYGQEMEVFRFSCPWASFPTFEISCTTEHVQECAIDIWTSQNQTWGLYLRQHQTL
ncbi:hypothetical protein C8Q72DRAFT_991249 [Fomitopsis betulina]|nr:hypothetical protein C8Q72DRAFT_991249 [Fomitopsis betulina]